MATASVTSPIHFRFILPSACLALSSRHAGPRALQVGGNQDSAAWNDRYTAVDEAFLIHEGE